jgi:hypothetical protein
MIACKLSASHNIPEAYFEQFNNIVRFAYNYRKKACLKENKTVSLSDIEKVVKDTMQHKALMDASLIKMAVNKSKSMAIHKDLVFAKKAFLALKNFRFRKDHNTPDDLEKAQKDYQTKKNNTLLLRGSSVDSYGNRKAQLCLERNVILFKPDKDHHFEINVENDRRIPQLRLLQHLCEQGLTSFTLEITRHSVSILYDETILPKKEGIRKKDRILAIDMNPNQIGVVVKNSKGVVFHEEIIDPTQLNLKTLQNKNKKLHETAEMAMLVIRLAKHYQCGTIAYEDLNIESKDHGKGRYFNRLCNNAWNRRRFIQILNKHACLNTIKTLAIQPAYSSFVGCLMHEDFDAIAAALEIHRRAIAFLQDQRYAWFPQGDPLSHLTPRWKEKLSEARITLKSWNHLYRFIKESRLSYRILFSPKANFVGSSFRLQSHTSLVTRHVLFIDRFVKI